jgi:hypothetical protein
MGQVATGTFEITMTPAEPEVGGAVGRFDFTKAFSGGLDGSGAGVMLSAGDPQSGAAGYVAIETFVGTLDGRDGGFALQQLGTMLAGEHILHYLVVPGSGHGDLAGITGSFQLTVDDDGTHRYALDYEI